MDGDVKGFDFQTLLISITSSFVLLSIVRILMDFCLVNCIPHNEDYMAAKFVETARYADAVIGNTEYFFRDIDHYEVTERILIVN
jgi:hypothetical protein